MQPSRARPHFRWERRRQGMCSAGAEAPLSGEICAALGRDHISPARARPRFTSDDSANEQCSPHQNGNATFTRKMHSARRLFARSSAAPLALPMTGEAKEVRRAQMGTPLSGERRAALGRGPHFGCSRADPLPFPTTRRVKNPRRALTGTPLSGEIGAAVGRELYIAGLRAAPFPTIGRTEKRRAEHEQERHTRAEFARRSGRELHLTSRLLAASRPMNWRATNARRPQAGSQLSDKNARR